MTQKEQLLHDITLIDSLESYFSIVERIDTLSYFKNIPIDDINELIDLTVKYYLIWRSRVNKDIISCA